MAVRARQWLLGLVACAALPACAVGPGGAAAGSVTPLTTQSDALQHYSGIVRDLAGAPAAGVVVRIFASDPGGAPLLSDAGNALIGKTKYGALAQAGTGRFGLRAVAGEARTDVAGRFALPDPGRPVTLEAIQADDVRAIVQGAVLAQGPVTLQLAYTGAISGRVTVPARPEVTNFEGTDVYIPGTSYVAKADRLGRFSLTNVAVGTFSLVASKVGLGRGQVDAVAVASRAVTQATDIALHADGPRIDAVSPWPAWPGQPLTIHGAGFGASSGAPFQVTLGGAVVGRPERVDDGTITLTFPSLFAAGAVDIGAGGSAAGAAAGGPGSAGTTDIQVTVAGLPSGSLSVARLTAIAPADPGLMWVVGDRHPAGALGLDSLGQVGPCPGADVVVSGAAIALVDGELRAIAPGEATLRLTAGNLSDVRTIRVVAPGVPRITPYVGFGVAGRGDGPAGAALLSAPTGMAMDEAGNLYVCDAGNTRIIRIGPDRRVETIAGGEPGFADGPGAGARFRNPVALALDGHGGLIIADDDNERVRRLDLNDPAHAVTTLAGSGAHGFHNGPGAEATFEDLAGVAVGPAGEVYVTEWANHAVRRIGFDTHGAATVTTYAGDGTMGYADGKGTLARFTDPDGLVAAPDGTLYVADGRNHCIRAIAPGGVVTTLSGVGPRGESDGAYADGPGDKAAFYWPRGLARGADGRLYVADPGNGCVRVVAPDGRTTTLLRGDGRLPGLTAAFGEILGVLAAPDGRVFVADAKKHLIHVYSP